MLLILYLLLLFFYFLYIGIVAGDFFCPNLNTISQFLNISENISGITILAFGNGAPDLFSSFLLFESGDPQLALSLLFGASSVITSVVVGLIGILYQFQVTRRPFLRDIAFYIGAVSMIIGCLWDNVITLTESILFIVYYVVYVLTVAIGRIIYQNTKKKRIRGFRRLNELEALNEENKLIEISDPYSSAVGESIILQDKMKPFSNFKRYSRRGSWDGTEDANITHANFYPSNTDLVDIIPHSPVHDSPVSHIISQIESSADDHSSTVVPRRFSINSAKSAKDVDDVEEPLLSPSIPNETNFTLFLDFLKSIFPLVSQFKKNTVLTNIIGILSAP
jgi:Ca2+/Na+ antiporter